MGILQSRRRDTALPREVAGVDLGSNSFHLVVARAEEDGRVHVLDRLRDPVRLAAGLSPDGVLSEEAVARGFEALQRFGERLRDMPSNAIRAVGTNTLRRARNGAAVEQAFGDALGHPIEIISGPEEARLIYSGVSHTSPDVDGRLLVLDIGGGSTECVIGAGFEPILVDSLYMGCVGYTERFFRGGKLNRRNFEQAQVAAGLELTSLVARYRELGWDAAVGSSGTINAVHEVLRANGWSEDGITREALERLIEALCACKRIANIELSGLDADRAAVFPGGVAILAETLELLEIDAMQPASGALREGLVYGLLGRVTEGDPRDATVERLQRRYKVDRAHAMRVATTAEALFESANEGWRHDDELAGRVLAYACALHEIGLSLAYAGHQKHGAYLLRHMDMAGFTVDEQTMLATIVGAHRRKLSRTPFEALPERVRELALHVTLALRLAVRLRQTRSSAELPELTLRAKGEALTLELPPGWLASRPLTRADLEKEVEQVARVGMRLELQDAATPS